jgi:hypothetical protein
VQIRRYGLGHGGSSGEVSIRIKATIFRGLRLKFGESSALYRDCQIEP